MKKIIWLSVMVCCMCLMSCGYTETQWETISYSHWENNSVHPITLIFYSRSTAGQEEPEALFEETIEAGGYFEIEQSEAPTMGLEKIIARFHDGTTVDFGMRYDADVSHSYVYLPVGYDPQYNIARMQNYSQEIVDSPEGCRECLGVRATYTFTDADYQYAKEWVEEAR